MQSATENLEAARQQQQSRRPVLASI